MNVSASFGCNFIIMDAAKKDSKIALPLNGAFVFIVFNFQLTGV